LRAEGFSCSLDVLYGYLGARDKKIEIFDKKYKIIFFSSKFFKFLVIKPLDPDRYSRNTIPPKMLDPGQL
jgi:hypothetical protein